jgi:alpha-beta hydrolase superfamily lysophospholipase
MSINASSAVGRRALLLATALAGCGPRIEGAGPPRLAPRIDGEALLMQDGFRLPLRHWPAEGTPRATILALHGFNDHAGAWDIPAPLLTGQGFDLYAYDQRGFGATATRGLWPGSDALADDAATAAALIAARAPGVPLVLLGESMGAAVLLVAGSRPPPRRPRADAWVLLAPAVWGRSTMNPIARGALWAMSHALPSLAVSGGNPFTRVTDDPQVLEALARDPALIRRTRMDAVAGIVDIMDDARIAAARFDPGPTLILWAGRDDLIPGGAMRSFLDTLPPAPPARREVQFDAGGFHLLLRDRGRGQRATLVGDFLRRYLPTALALR